ncbi:AIS_collapsed_G0006750.mRNA.1.CDS.1 [Saccharomyces cerevisiae]|nr:AIS_collapsed_G0006750.mRNA.1.CDS.1 [Saccharomyces cerevisiae]
MNKPEEVVPIMELCAHSHSLNSRGNPIIVHCSAGVGRTGTFIALDHLMHDTLDFKKITQHLRLLDEPYREVHTGLDRTDRATVTLAKNENGADKGSVPIHLPCRQVSQQPACQTAENYIKKFISAFNTSITVQRYN